MKSNKVIFCLLGLAAALYFQFLPAFFVGYFNDDALCVLAAKSLTMGRYVALEHPRQLPINDLLPGFPFLLAIFMKATHASFAALKAIPFMLTLISSILLWILVEDLLVPVASVVVVTLYAFNPAVVLYSSSLLSESFFVALVLALFCCLKRMYSRQQGWEVIAASGILAWAVLVRPQGFILIPSVLIGLFYEHRWKASALVLPAVFLLIRNYLVVHSVSGYLSVWSTHWPTASNLYASWLFNAARVGEAIFTDLLLAWPSPILLWGGRALGLVVLLLGVWGVNRLVRSKLAPVGLLVSVFLFVVLYSGIQSVWMVTTDRYFIPLLPFLLIAVASAISGTLRTDAGVLLKKSVILLVALCLGLYAFRLMTYYAQIRETTRPALSRFPGASFEWVREHTTPSDLFLSPVAPVLYLYTERQAFRSIPASDIEAFRYQLLRQGVRYILLRDQIVLSFLVSNPSEIPLRSWTLSWPEAFPYAYRNDAEATFILGVPSDARFMKAYGEYLDAMSDLEASQWSAGRTKLNEALKIYPSLASAHNASGVSFMLKEGDWKQAEEQFLEASKLQPSYKQPLLNLTRLYRTTGKLALAQEYATKAARLNNSR